MYKIYFRKMAKNVHGLIDHSKGIIIINGANSKARQKLALTHEILHLLDYLRKRDRSERETHELAFDILYELYPLLKHFDN